MKTLHCICYTGFTMALLTAAAQAMNTAAVNEVLKLSKAGLGEDGVVAFINSKSVNYDLSSDDIILLKNQGLSSAVLAAMLKSAGPQGFSTPFPAPAPQAAPVVIPTAPTVAPAPIAAAAPTVVPPALSSDAVYFYQQLSPYGRWLLAEDNQWYWQPTVAVTTPTWRPYWDQGHWVYTDSGWYWASDYPWGWAPFHYGRWRLHPLHGWMWSPDRVWGPAWVTWRTGGAYCGWAPLPPGAAFDAAGLLVFHGRHVGVDFDFGFDWHHFNFCLVRDLGERRFAGIRREAQRRELFAHTTVINHYSVDRHMVDGHADVRVINHGIEPTRVAAVKGHGLETIKIEELRTPAPDHGHERFDKGRQTIEVYRPRWDDRH